MSNFIWVIQVEGNINVPSEDIISLMEDMGVEKGKSLKNFDFDRAQQEALLQLPQLSWLAINKIGSTVTIEVKERDLPPEIVPKNTPCHVKAAKDGQIINMEVFSGSEAVARGDMVSKGDIIISGIVQDKKGNVSIKHARANILALTQTQLEVRVSRLQQEKKYTSAEKNKRTLRLLGFRVPLYIKQDPGPDYDVFTNEKKATFFGLELPFSIETKNYKKFTVENRELTPEEMKELAYKKMEEKAEIEFKTVSVVGKELTEEVSEEEFVLKGEYTCQESIGYEEAFDPAAEAPPPPSSSEEATE